MEKWSQDKDNRDSWNLGNQGRRGHRGKLFFLSKKYPYFYAKMEIGKRRWSSEGRRKDLPKGILWSLLNIFAAQGKFVREIDQNPGRRSSTSEDCGAEGDSRKNTYNTRRDQTDFMKWRCRANLKKSSKEKGIWSKKTRDWNMFMPSKSRQSNEDTLNPQKDW